LGYNHGTLRSSGLYARQEERVIAKAYTICIGTVGQGPWQSPDGGETWHTLPLPVEPNSPLYGFAVNAANPDRLLSYSLFGEIYTSEDAGDSWQKVKREFGEIRAIAWCPNENQSQACRVSSARQATLSPAMLSDA
jgi:photosystem II stability/assembly factor-like uncharacterized protein